MRVSCSIQFTELENDDGLTVEAVCATCSRCDHETQSFGTSARSIRRCLLMREECPEGEDNFYTGENGWEDDE
jgi:hypothetical protein